MVPARCRCATCSCDATLRRLAGDLGSHSTFAPLPTLLLTTFNSVLLPNTFAAIGDEPDRFVSFDRSASFALLPITMIPTVFANAGSAVAVAEFSSPLDLFDATGAAPPERVRAQPIHREHPIPIATTREDLPREVRQNSQLPPNRDLTFSEQASINAGRIPFGLAICLGAVSPLAERFLECGNSFPLFLPWFRWSHKQFSSDSAAKRRQEKRR